MTKFILKIGAFFLLVIFTIVMLYCYWYNKKQKEIIKIPTSNIIIGDSNTRWSISDSILKNYSNFSTGGETYLFALNKLRVFEKNNKIDTLLLSFSPHNVINNMWWNDEGITPLDNRMGAFYQDFSLADHLKLLRETPKNYIISLSKIGNGEVKSIFATHKKESPMFRFGSYLPNKQNETQIKITPFPYKKAVITDVELEYLQKIVKECKKKKIYLIFIQTPKNYLRKDYPNYNQNEFYSLYQKHFKNVDFLDFSHLKLPKHAYWDMIHVDIVGAEYFSAFLQQNGIKNLLKSNYNLKHDHR